MPFPRNLRALASRGLGAFREARIRWQQPRSAPITTVWTRGAEAVHAGAPDFDGERAFDLLRAQCELGPRFPGSAAHAAMPAWLDERLRPWCDEIAVQRWSQRVARGPGAGRTFAMTNLFARIGGDGPAIMLSAHWDTRPVADRDPDPAKRALPIDGANDGASGVAVLLELARALRARPAPRPVILAFWDGEDFGEYYYGSRLFARHAASPDARRWRAESGIVLDMVGKKGLRCVSELHSMREAPGVWAAVHESAVALGLEASFGGGPYAIRDDHSFLNGAGIPTVLFIDYAYPEWHTTLDTVDRCSADSLQTVGSVVLHWARRPA